MNNERGPRTGAWWPATSWPVAAQWASLVAISALISAIWTAIGLPAALMLGPMIGGIVFGVHGLRLATPPWSSVAAQAVIGAMVSAAITPSIVATFSNDAPLFSIVIAATLLGAACLGWLISRAGLLPGATAIYGISPGAASAMVLLGAAEGADPQLVAVMQYSRVLFVVIAAALVARFWAGVAGVVHIPGTPLLAPVNWINLATVLLLAAVGQQAARLLRLRGWAVLGPMFLLSGLHAAGWITIELPSWLLAATYAVIGWGIGLGFRREVLLHARRAMPVIAGAALCLIAFCGLLAWCLVRLAHVDPLTAYLATSPGGLDSVAIIAASTPRVDLPFVLALQAVRLLLVLSAAPLITRLVVRHSPHLRGTPNA
jgi:uncharacterized protein